jgi:hypothetical protein
MGSASIATTTIQKTEATMTATKQHARLSPSSAPRWFACSGSVNLSDKAPAQESSDAADEGTAGHSLLEKCVLEASNTSEFLGLTIGGYLVNEEMASSVQLAVDYVFKKRSEIGGTVEVEERLDLTKIHPDIFGTLDICIFKKGKRLVIIDFKYGLSRVEVRDNKQLLTYALGAALKHGFDFEEAELVIVQPRAPHPEGTIRSWVVTKQYLQSWSPILAEAARLTESPDAPLVLGEHCGFCPAKGICPRQNEVVEKSLMISTKDKTISLPSIANLTDEQIVRIIEHQGQIEDFLSEVKRLALHRLKAGEKIEGLKLVAGRGSRVWIDEEAVATHLVALLSPDLAYSKKLLSPAQAETLLPKTSLEHLWTKIDGNETVAHSSDRRKEIQPVAGKLVLNSKGAKHA